MDPKFNKDDEIIIFDKCGTYANTCKIKFGKINKLNKIEPWGSIQYQCKVISVSWEEDTDATIFTTMNIPVYENYIVKKSHGMFEQLGL